MKNALLVLACAAAVAVAGVAGLKARADDKPKVAFITSTSRLGDKGFNDAVAAGVTRAAHDWGLAHVVIQSMSDTDYVPNLKRAAGNGYGVIMVAGFQMGDSVREVAPLYPAVKFGAADVELNPSLPNVREMLFHEEQPSYLLGVLSASMAAGNTAPIFEKKHALAVVAGVEQPAVNRFVTGFLCGARSVGQDIPIYVYYTGTWQNPPLYREAALAAFNRGAGAIFEIGGVAGLAIIEASKELGFLEMTTDQDKNDLSPNTVLSSAEKDLEQATYLTIKDTIDRHWQGGKYRYSLANGGVKIAPFHGLQKYVTPAVEARVDEARKAIIAGTVKVPMTLEEGEACLSGVQFKRPK